VRLSNEKFRGRCEAMPFGQRDNGLFAAFAPPDDPQIAVAVVAEHACHGASGAAPIALAVIKAYLQKYMPEKYSDEAIKVRLKKGVVAKSVAKPKDEDEEEVRLNDVNIVEKPKPIVNPAESTED
jgi:penicillin-binding protein 2